MFRIVCTGFAAVLISSGLLCFDAQAQQGGDTGGGFGGQTGGTGTGTGAGTGTGTDGSMIGLDPDAAFSAVDRSGAVGEATATVGADASEAGAGPAGGLGGAGGFGGGIGGGGGLGGFGGLGGLGNLFGGGFGAGGGAESARPAIRTRLRSAIDVAPIAPAQVQQNANGRFRDLYNRPAYRGINVFMQDRTAILRGTVPDESSRRMSELLLRLEPGISRVDNQITVAQ